MIVFLCDNDDNKGRTPGFNQTAIEFAGNIRVGWNLGNSLDAHRTWGAGNLDGRTQADMERYWGNPPITREQIQTVRDAGFNAIRIPVTWRHFTGPGPYYVIEDVLMRRVRHVVDYAIGLDMYVKINIHHDDHTHGWLFATPEARDGALLRLGRLWTQIATEFRNYDERLIFEGMNEVRTAPGSFTSGTPENRAIINQFNQRFVDTVRATGGNNRYRFLVVKTHAGFHTDSAFDGFILPQDDRLIVSVHIYSVNPASIRHSLRRMNRDFVQNGVPIFIGEWGTQANANVNRVEHADMFMSYATQYGATAFWWDNGSTGANTYRLLNRETLAWVFPDIVAAIMDNVF